MATPKYIMDFIAAVYGRDYVDLAMASFSEKTAIMDATTIINDLRRENKELREQLANGDSRN